MAKTINITKEMQSATSAINKKRSAAAVAAKSTDANTVRQQNFKKYVSATKCYVSTVHSDAGGNAVKNTYLKAEAWLYLASLFNLNVVVSATELSRDPYAVMVNVRLLDEDGEIVSSGAMSASKSENWLKDKPDFAVLGLAQTRAISRAVRNKYGWFVRLCGYESTPSEEVEK